MNHFLWDLDCIKEKLNGEGEASLQSRERRVDEPICQDERLADWSAPTLTPLISLSRPGTLPNITNVRVYVVNG